LIEIDAVQKFVVIVVMAVHGSDSGRGKSIVSGSGISGAVGLWH